MLSLTSQPFSFNEGVRGEKRPESLLIIFNRKRGKIYKPIIARLTLKVVGIDVNVNQVRIKYALDGALA